MLAARAVRSPLMHHTRAAQPSVVGSRGHSCRFRDKGRTTMELLSNLALGFVTALSLTNLLYALIGALIGTLIGVLPGIGPVATLAMLLPTTYALDPTPALIMLAGIYYGAQYGGSTTAILVNIPGETSSVVTTLDGHQMARRG